MTEITEAILWIGFFVGLSLGLAVFFGRALERIGRRYPTSCGCPIDRVEMEIQWFGVHECHPPA